MPTKSNTPTLETWLDSSILVCHSESHTVTGEAGLKLIINIPPNTSIVADLQQGEGSITFKKPIIIGSL